MGFHFPKSLRLRRRGQFLLLGKRGRTFSDGRCSAQWLRTDLDCVRLGLTVSARTGMAVERNLFKRRAREAFRLSTLKNRQGLDLNIRPRQAIDISFQEFVEFFLALERYVFEKK